ncbi:MAG: glycosyltransferase family 2 protein [Chloroflexi bacterium]|nr:glycosyltransferase family 2 protein [Chloroflexota bacterium]
MSTRRPTLTAAVIARDEEHMLAQCLETLRFADERLVLVDAATRDKTREIARACGARVEERAFDNFAAQRQAALRLARGEWVLFVDADERVSTALRDEITSMLAARDDRHAFWIPRDNYILGRLVRHAGWYPDYQLRLLNREFARMDPQRVVHERALVDGPVGHLHGAFIHYNYSSFGDLLRKQQRYSQLEAERWLLTYGRPRRRALIGQPAREFWRRFVILGGYRDGPIGLLLSLVMAWYAGRAVWLALKLTSLRAPATVRPS